MHNSNVMCASRVRNIDKADLALCVTKRVEQLSKRNLRREMEGADLLSVEKN